MHFSNIHISMTEHLWWGSFGNLSLSACFHIRGDLWAVKWSRNELRDALFKLHQGHEDGFLSMASNHGSRVIVFFLEMEWKINPVSLAECEMTGCDSDTVTVTQMLKYNQAQNSPGTENISSMFWESKGEKIVKEHSLLRLETHW